jgi:hypothetical protein
LLLLSEIPGAFWLSFTNPKRSMPQLSARCNQLRWICKLDWGDWDIMQRHWRHWCYGWDWWVPSVRKACEPSPKIPFKIHATIRFE